MEKLITYIYTIKIKDIKTTTYKKLIQKPKKQHDKLTTKKTTKTNKKTKKATTIIKNNKK